MNPPRSQFTLRELMALVAFLAASLASIGTPALTLIVSIWIVLPGIVIDRSRGGEGVLGGSLAGGFAAAGMLWRFPDLLFRNLPQPDLRALVFSSLLFVPFGMIYGAVVSDTVCMLIGLLRGKSASIRGELDH